MSLFSKTVAERTRPGTRSDVEEKDYTFHAYARSEGIAGILISDATYPVLVAHQVLSKVLDEFLTKNPRSTFMSPGVTTVPFPELKGYLSKFQDPSQADSIMKVQRELDETKIVLHKTIESVLERGEKIDSLVAKSDGLSSQSKMFYNQVRCHDGEGFNRFSFPYLFYMKSGPVVRSWRTSFLSLKVSTDSIKSHRPRSRIHAA